MRVGSVPGVSSNDRPTLWHIPVSHFSEKARWALDHKRVAHRRRAPVPPSHMVISRWLTRGSSYTFPVLSIDGRHIGDSTEIIAVVEELVPDPPLYPADPSERERALELEEFFDENLGPQIRLFGWHELRSDPDRLGAIAASMLPAPASFRESAFARSSANVIAGPFVKFRYDADNAAASAAARDATIAAMDRLDAELEAVEGDHLAGDAFSVADLTAAALFYPLVNPAGAPTQFADQTPSMAALSAELSDRPGFAWVERTYAAYRKPEVPIPA